MVARSLDARSAVFVDEMGTNIPLSLRYMGGPRRDRGLTARFPRDRGKNTTLLSGTAPEGTGASLAVEGATNAKAFGTYVELRVPGPTPRKGRVVIVDDLSAHEGERVGELVEGRGRELSYPPPYSPGLDPIEEAFSKTEGTIREAAEARGREALPEATGTAISAITDRDARGFFEHRGYRAPVQMF
jgi:transposase